MTRPSIVCFWVMGVSSSTTSQIAELAVGLLAARLGPGAAEPPREAVAGFELVVRESSAVGRLSGR